MEICSGINIDLEVVEVIKALGWAQCENCGTINDDLNCRVVTIRIGDTYKSIYIPIYDCHKCHSNLPQYLE